MNPKHVVPGEQANADIVTAIDHYLQEAGDQAALGFIDALEQAFRHIGRHPGSGSPRYAHELDLPGLRSWPLKRYPYLIFFVEHDVHVAVWRILHGERDIPAWTREAPFP